MSGADRSVQRLPFVALPDGTVMTGGQAVLLAEAGRVAEIKARAAIPVAASPEIVAAVARGPSRVAPQFTTVMTPSGPRVRPATAVGFHPVQAADAFDRMAARAGDGPQPFTVAQVEAGRAYAALVERVAAEGMRCASGEAMGQAGGGGNGRDWIEGVMGRSERLARMRAAIGDGKAIWPGRGRDLAQGAKRLSHLRLVEMVCCGGRDLTSVLRWAGVTVKGTTRAALRAELAACLDRIHGM